MSSVVCFVGLGTMGGPMAVRLLDSGFDVRGVDTDSTAREAFMAAGGTASSNIADAASEAEFVITMLPRDEHVEGALVGDNGVIAHAPAGALVLEMSTISPTASLTARERLSQAGLRMMDAPVGRTPGDAQAGTLLVMAGGDPHDFSEAQPLFETFADRILHMGPHGSGIRMKVINNYMSMVNMVLTSEALTMTEKAGIDVDSAVNVLQNTAAGRGQINTNFPNKVLSGDITPDFPLKLGHKDLTLALGLGLDLNVPLFLGASARELFGLAPVMGRADEDCTAMLLMIKELAGIATAGSSRP